MSTDTPKITQELVEKYQRQLAVEPQILVWLKETRGLNDDVISKFKLGWTGNALSIPIYDKDNNWLFFKYRHDPRTEIREGEPKYWYDPGGSATIYGWEHIVNPKPTLILCAGELDRLKLETHGYAAVTLTSGESSFNEKWAAIFNALPSEIPVCYDNDNTGAEGAAKVLELVPKAKIVSIPKIEGVKDVTEFIVARGIDEFTRLINDAKVVDGTEHDESLPIVDNMTRINLALDFTKDMALVTQPFPTREETRSGETVIRDEYWVISSDRKIFLAARENLYERGLYAAGNCFIPEARWKYADIKKWLAGKSKSDPGQLFTDIRDLFIKYLDYRDVRLYTLFAIWVIGTYVFPLFDFFAILFFSGVSGSGKTKTACLIERLAFNAVNSANISDASFFRTVQGSRATLILDEAETIDDPIRIVLINLVLAGISKQGRVIRTEQKGSGEFVPTTFEVFSPKLIANIKGAANEALLNRCIMVMMTPTTAQKSGLAIEGEDPETFVALRSHLYIFMMEHWASIKNMIPTVQRFSKDLGGYDFMIWKPLFAIASYLQQYVSDEPIVDTIQAISVEKTTEKKNNAAMGQDTTLLEVLADMFRRKIELKRKRVDGAEFYATKNVRDLLAYQMDMRVDSDDYKKLTDARVGWMIRHMDVGEMKQERVEGEPKPVRGAWINITRLNAILSRFGMPIVDEASRLENKTNIEDVIGSAFRGSVNMDNIDV